MKLRLSHKRSLISLTIVFVWILIVWIVVYPSEGYFGEFIGVILVYYYTLGFAIMAFIIFFLLFAFGLIKSRNNFFYNFIGTLNLIWGIIGLFLSMIGEPDESFIPIILSFVCGCLIYKDIYNKELNYN